MNPILYLGIVMAGYVFLRAVWPLGIHWTWKVLLGLPLFAAGTKFHLIYLFGGPMFFAPEVPGWVQLAGAGAFTFLFFYFVLLAATEVASACFFFILYWKKKKIPVSFNSMRNRIHLILLIVSLFPAVIGLVNGTASPEIKEKTIFLQALPAEADGMTIAVLSDLHIDRITPPGRIRDIVERVNAVKPDLIVIVGDTVDGKVESIGNDLLPFQDFSAKYGVFGVPGNHEYYSGHKEWMDFFSALGIRMLENKNVFLPERNTTLAGVTDHAAERKGGVLPDMNRALYNTPPDSLKILLAHRPDLVMAAEKEGVTLQISGHTHGGMLFGLNWIVAQFNSGFVSGIYPVGRMTLYVTSGSGIWNGFPVRLGVPSEITLLRLRKKTE